MSCQLSDRSLSVRTFFASTSFARTFFASFLLFALLAPAALASPADGSCPGLGDEDEMLPIDPDPLSQPAATELHDSKTGRSSEGTMGGEDEMLPIEPDPASRAAVAERIVNVDFPVRLAR